MKKITARSFCFGLTTFLVMSGFNISYNGDYKNNLQQEQLKMELISEIERSESNLNYQVRGTVNELKNEDSSIENEQTIDSQEYGIIKLRISEDVGQLDELNGYEDFDKINKIYDENGEILESVEEVEAMLKRKSYIVNQEYLKICDSIEEYKGNNPNTKAKDVVVYLEEKYNESKYKNSILSFSNVTNVYASAYDTWNSLTTEEKLLIASDPKAALVTQSCKDEAFAWTDDRYGFNGLGNESDGYRHGIWNALMTRDISRAWAKSYATAHESKSDDELNQTAEDGYLEREHRDMDLHNNEIGRSLIKWYEFGFNCSDNTVRSRVANKLTNDSSGIYWLHD